MHYVMETKKFWIEFLHLYRDQPCLWDYDSSDYSRKDLKDLAYNKLLDLYRTVDKTATLYAVKKKIDIFRSGFRREEKKIILCDNVGEQYTPTLWYYKELSFLSKYLKLRSLKVSGFSEPKHEFFDDEDQANMEILSVEYDEEPDSPPDKKRKSSASDQNGVPDKKRRKREEFNEPAEILPTSFEPEDGYYNSYEDECSIFCTNLRLQMRGLETEQKYICQKLISDAVFLARTSQLNLTSHIRTEPRNSKGKRVESNNSDDPCDSNMLIVKKDIDEHVEDDDVGNSEWSKGECY